MSYGISRGKHKLTHTPKLHEKKTASFLLISNKKLYKSYSRIKRLRSDYPNSISQVVTGFIDYLPAPVDLCLHFLGSQTCPWKNLASATTSCDPAQQITQIGGRYYKVKESIPRQQGENWNSQSTLLLRFIYQSILENWNYLESSSPDNEEWSEPEFLVLEKFLHYKFSLLHWWVPQNPLLLKHCNLHIEKLNSG